MKKYILLLILLCVVLCSGCIARPIISTAPNTNQPTHQPNSTPSPTPSIDTPTATTTPTPTPVIPFTPDQNTYGPFVFGEYMYYLYIEAPETGATIRLIDANTGKVVLNDFNRGFESLEKTLITASIMDLNFDNIPDFSYVRSSDNKRCCWLADGYMDVVTGDVVIKSYYFHDTLSMIPNLTRCYETQTIYGLDIDGTNAVYSYKYNYEKKNYLVKSTELTEVFEWNIDKIAYAITGPGSKFIHSENVVLRENTCRSYIIAGYLTIALDDYGNFYIKDLPQDGFYRLSLNPNGNWSKSEKISQGLALPSADF